MPDEICTACGGTMHFDDFTGTLICSVCGSSRAISSATAPASVPAPAPSTASPAFPVSVPSPTNTPAPAPEPSPVSVAPSVSETLPEKPAAEPPVAEPADAAAQPVTKPATQPSKRPVSSFPNAFKGATVSEKKPVSHTAKPRPPRADALSTSGKNTISDARELMVSGQFKDALDRMNKMQRSDKATSVFLLLNIICGYQVQSTEELLLKVSGSPMAIQKLLFRPDWDLISERKPGVEDFSSYVKEYFVLCLIQNGTDIRELRMKMRGSNKGPRLSPLAKLDEEDSHNAERAAQLKAARNSSYKTLAERMEDLEDLPYPDYDYPFGYDDHYREYQAEIRAMAAAGEIRRQRGSEVNDQAKTEEVIKLPQVRPDITPEEIIERKEELIRLIRQEEQKILE